MSTSGRSFDSASPVPFNQPEDLAIAAGSFDLIGESSATRRLRLQIDRIGPHFRSVLVQGEMGTGKELVARALHAKARGPAGQFRTCYGAALADTASERPDSAGSPWRPILGEHMGTVFLEGVDDLSLPAQKRLLDLMSGWTQHRAAHRRMIAATSQSLRRMLGAGRFRADLYQQLATVEIAIEPLRRRRDDISALAVHLVERIAKAYGREAVTIAEDAMFLLRQYDWPGNVREMENVLRNAILRCDGDVVESTHLDSLLRFTATPALYPKGTEVEKLDEIVERHVRHVLDLCSGNKVRAAELLGISRSTLYRMLEGTAQRVR